MDVRSPDYGRFTYQRHGQNVEYEALLDHLNQSYTLNHHEIKTAKNLKNELLRIDANYTKDTERIEAGEAVYRDVIRRFDETKLQLTAIEKQQVHFNQLVAGLKKGDFTSNKQADCFEPYNGNIKHETFRHHYAGYAQLYVDKVKHVTREIDQLNHDLDQVKINMERIRKFLINLRSDIDDLN